MQVLNWRLVIRSLRKRGSEHDTCRTIGRGETSALYVDGCRCSRWVFNHRLCCAGFGSVRWRQRRYIAPDRRRKPRAARTLMSAAKTLLECPRRSRGHCPIAASRPTHSPAGASWAGLARSPLCSSSIAPTPSISTHQRATGADGISLSGHPATRRRS